MLSLECSRWATRAAHLVLAGSLLAAAGCAGVTSAFEASPLPRGAREIKDIPYRHGAGFDRRKHRLDLYVPSGPGPHPILVFVHGGGWRSGDRHAPFDVYGRLGRRFAASGILTAVISYRLAPDHKFPDSIRDVSRAIGAVRSNAPRYGGDQQRLFVMGHSSGAHLAALAACDPRWLEEAGLTPNKISGVVAISGPYDLKSLASTARAMVESAFGRHESVWLDASPATHLGSESVPPFFVAYGREDPEMLRSQGHAFAEALKEHGATVVEQVAEDRTHIGIIMRLGASDDPLGRAIIRFIQPQPAHEGAESSRPARPEHRSS
jgi:acetyl esterase/lipase